MIHRSLCLIVENMRKLRKEPFQNITMIVSIIALLLAARREILEEMFERELEEEFERVNLRVT